MDCAFPPSPNTPQCVPAERKVAPFKLGTFITAHLLVQAIERKSKEREAADCKLQEAVQKLEETTVQEVGPTLCVQAEDLAGCAFSEEGFFSPWLQGAAAFPLPDILPFPLSF